MIILGSLEKTELCLKKRLSIKKTKPKDTTVNIFFLCILKNIAGSIMCT